MSKIRICAVQRCTASPESVYEVLADVPNWPSWMTPLSAAVFERQGIGDPRGAGAIRRLTAMKFFVAREEILEARPPQLQKYAIVSGLPVSDYVGTVRIDAEGSGCRITWEAEFSAAVPAIGGALRAVLQRVVTWLASGVARAAERSNAIPPCN